MSEVPWSRLGRLVVTTSKAIERASVPDMVRHVAPHRQQLGRAHPDAALVAVREALCRFKLLATAARDS